MTPKTALTAPKAGPEFLQHPIAALASGAAAAAVAIVRLSGRECHALLARCFQPTGVAAWSERELRLGRLILPETGAVLDEVMAVKFAGPRSYTGEDMAEVHCHGGPYVVQRVLALFYSLGFRPAEPGEYTRRAFLNGKLDLTAAEGIRELAAAASAQQWVAARHLAAGKLKDAVQDLRTALVQTLAHLEAQIDFPDEGDVARAALAHVKERAADVACRIQRLLASYGSGRVASQGLMVALCGEPNAGKSTLLNELLGKERAIVTPHAGTTRDYLEESCLVDGRLVRLVDMAGLRESTDPVEALGIEAARRLARTADLVLFLAPADGADGARATAAWIDEFSPKDALRILTKADLGKPAWAAGWTEVSCKDGRGLDELRTQLAGKVDRHMDGLGAEDAFVTTARQAAALTAAAQAIQAFDAAYARGNYEEMLAFELHEAARALQSIIGEVGSEDVLDAVFREFCVGK